MNESQYKCKNKNLTEKNVEVGAICNNLFMLNINIESDAIGAGATSRCGSGSIAS
jgi:hypothetical protein